MRALSRGTISTRPRSSTSSAIKILPIRKASLQTRATRQITHQHLVDVPLVKPNFWYYWRPVFKKTWGFGRERSIDRRHTKSMRGDSDILSDEYLARFESTGVTALPRGPLPYDKESSTITNYDTPWYSVVMVRNTCRVAFEWEWPLFPEVEARKACAEARDARYPKIYRTLEKQAHITYLVGRVELERDPTYRPFAWYMLSIAAGIGQLDAALLLHQLEKCDGQLAVHAEQRAVITKAAKERIDWRAMVVYCEHMISTGKGRGGLGKLQAEDLEECLDMLDHAMSLTRPSEEAPVERQPPPQGFLDLDTLEQIDPPYIFLLAIIEPEIAAGNRSEKLTSLYEKAARTGGLEYGDPDAAWQYVVWHLVNEKDYTREWVSCVETAANAGNADACFQLARYCFHRDGWHPTAASVELGEIGAEDKERNQDEEVKLHEAILHRRNDHLLRAQDGMYWMKIAAQFHIDSATKILNRYCIVAGLLRQNGFLSEGREVLLEAQQQLKKCIDNRSSTNRALQVLNEFLQFWDERLIHQLLDPESIDRLLNSLPKL